MWLNQVHWDLFDWDFVWTWFWAHLAGLELDLLLDLVLQLVQFLLQLVHSGVGYSLLLLDSLQPPPQLVSLFLDLVQESLGLRPPVHGL